MTESDNQPVFIAGFPRTGTTLLLRILNRHPSFRSKKELPAANLVEAQFYRRFFQNAVELWESKAEPELRTWFGDESKYYTRFLISLFRAFHHESARARGVSRILEKTPDNLLIADLIIASFPLAKILLLRRDPADTLASFRRRRKLESGSAGTWLDVAANIQEFVDVWNQKSSIWAEFEKRNPESTYVVDFDTLTRKSHSVISELLTFLNEELLELTGGVPPTTRSSILDGYESHVPVPNAGDWECLVTVDEATYARQQCFTFGLDC